jgi:hypothetical protein
MWSAPDRIRTCDLAVLATGSSLLTDLDGEWFAA